MNDIETEKFLDEVLLKPEKQIKVNEPPVGETSTGGFFNAQKQVAIDLIDDFPKHPFKVVEDEDLLKLVESIKEIGLINPPIVRKKDDGRYELISGHRRKLACKLVGMTEISVVIKELDKDTATLLMVASNMQREKILPSEKAFSYKMKLDALKRQGKRSDLTSSQVGTKLRADEKIADENGDSRNQVQRYIRLTNLTPQLLELVDEQKIAFSPAVEISYLTKPEQKQLLNAMKLNDCTPSHAQAIRLKKLSVDSKLNEETILEIMSEEKPNQAEQFKIKKDELRQYFPRSFTDKQILDTMMDLLEQYKKRREQNRDAR